MLPLQKSVLQLSLELKCQFFKDIEKCGYELCQSSMAYGVEYYALPTFRKYLV